MAATQTERGAFFVCGACGAQNVAKSTGVLDLAQYVLGLSLR